MEWIMKWIMYWNVLHQHNRIRRYLAEIRELRRKLAISQEAENIRKERLESWIARAEGGRYRELYHELKNKPNHLEKHCARQAQIINWLQAEFDGSFYYAKNLMDRAKESAKHI